MERNEPGSTVALGAANPGMMDAVYAEYVKKYGQDNADYLREVMGEWGSHYDRAVYIDMGTSDDDGIFEQMAREQAQQRGWLFERKQGNRRLIEMLVRGEWPEDEFLFVPPGYAIRQTTDDNDLITIERVDKNDE